MFFTLMFPRLSSICRFLGIILQVFKVKTIRSWEISLGRQSRKSSSNHSLALTWELHRCESKKQFVYLDQSFPFSLSLSLMLSFTNWSVRCSNASSPVLATSYWKIQWLSRSGPISLWDKSWIRFDQRIHCAMAWS
jgi:hypothetical protein